MFGDRHGNVVHLFERDCSLQRRHQKVIEEAPAPGMDEATRAAVCKAAVDAGKAVDYVGAGTIEFIADGSDGLRADRIWFMEMNTRLQVEHPVTEEITGIDLVEWQLRVASGEPLPRRQDELSINGWAMEARLYAEDPVTGFLPSTGPLDILRLPNDLRIETGVEEGDAVSPFYDPMIAKLVATGQDRTSAIRALAAGCRRTMVDPVKTNAWFLARLVETPEFLSGNFTTGFIGAEMETLAKAPQPTEALLRAAADQEIFQDDFVRGQAGDPEFDRLAGMIGFRLNASPDRRVRLSVDSDVIEVEYRPGGEQAYWDAGGGCSQLGQETVLFADGAAFSTKPFRRDAEDGAAAGSGAILSPMPGKVIAVDVAAGDAVKKGQKLLTLEAMKMEHMLTAPFDGIVAELTVSAGAQVKVEALLARIEKAEA